MRPGERLLIHGVPAFVRFRRDGATSWCRQLERTGPQPMALISLNPESREELWPDDTHIGLPVLLPGGEEGRLLRFEHSPDWGEWTWALEFGGQRRDAMPRTRGIRHENHLESPTIDCEEEFMKITIQYFDGCPHWNVAERRLQSVLRSLGRDNVVVDHQLIESPEAAERAHFRGSPTILIEGHDPFAKEDQTVRSQLSGLRNSGWTSGGAD